LIRTADAKPPKTPVNDYMVEAMQVGIIEVVDDDEVD
jgi:hypothetical protein